MNQEEIICLIERGFETSTLQFKVTINNINQLSQEMVAFSNTLGGILVIGVTDEGKVHGLSGDEIRKINQWIGSASTELIKPPISPLTDVIQINGKNVLVVEIRQGASKPYYTNEGISYIKKGSDKRIAPPEEILRMFQESGKIYADETIIRNSSAEDIDENIFKEFIYNKFFGQRSGVAVSLQEFLQLPMSNALEMIKVNAPLETVLKNMVFSDGNNLTLAGLMLFGKNPQHFKPMFTVQCVSYAGNDIAGTHFRDSQPPYEGNLKMLFENAMTFLKRNLRYVQVQESFNSLGELEIPQATLEELLVNSLVHRDYYIDSTVKVLMFDNRIEIVSPGKIPNSLTIENIINGQSIPRNPIIHSNAQFLLPYRGLGSGIPRALRNYKNIEFVNDESGGQFKAIIYRAG
ncbi:MAG: putative DNA binding domain-containing protein [Ignavibacteriae bacterium]|nr:putative DNA binding domain-containing protein [Ignavibacteriota bacterium]